LKKFLVIAVALALVLVTFSSAFAGQDLKVKPWVYDPGKTGISEAKWVTGVGLPDGGSSNHSLFLSKMGLTSDNAAGGATVEAGGGTLTELGFDYRNDGHCGAGAPRFNVYTSTGVYYFFGCTYGVHTPVPDHSDWTRVRFGPADAVPSDGVTAFPGFGSVTVTGIEIVFDEGNNVGPGFVYLDNIDVNGVLAGKPGNAK